MRLKLLFFIFSSCGSVLLIQTARAQQLNPKQEYLLTEAGDTVRGTLELPRFVTEYGVKLRVGAEPPRAYSLSTARGFATADGRRYQRRRVSFMASQPIIRQNAEAKATDSTAVFLQELVVGKARLYRLDYRLHPDQTPLEYTAYETTFYYLQVPNSSLVLLRPDTYQQVIWRMFQDCVSVQNAIKGTQLTGAGLARLVLRYNATCGAGFAAPRALALTSDEAGTQFRFGLRAGVAIGSLSYSDSYYLNDTNFGSKANYTAGISLTISTPKRVSLVTGVYFTARRNQHTNTRVVSAGFTNQGETLALPAEASVNTIQVPLLATIALTKNAAGARPFINFGALPGVAFGEAVAMTVPTSTLATGNFKLTQTAIATDGLGGGSKTTPLLGLQVGTGIAPRIGTHSLLAEIYYEAGRQLVGGTSTSGKFTYQAAGLRVGIDF